jgi:hypothetical protein
LPIVTPVPSWIQRPFCIPPPKKCASDAAAVVVCHVVVLFHVSGARSPTTLTPFHENDTSIGLFATLTMSAEPVTVIS